MLIREVISTMEPRAVLVVGCGFAGAVYARCLAEAGFHVDILDSRPHIAGNAYDYTSECGTFVHAYGPHCFHTSNEKVFSWLSQFTGWKKFELRVKAQTQFGIMPLPVNRTTIESLYNTRFETNEEVREFLSKIAVRIADIRTAEDYLLNTLGKTITDTFYRPYTKTMWGCDLSDLDASVVKRLPIRLDREDRYFPEDEFQFLPDNGYTRMFENILDHSNIRISLSTKFDRTMTRGYSHSFLSCAIDEYFSFRFGELPYRSVRFELSHNRAFHPGSWAITNFTDGGRYTRATRWGALATGKADSDLITVEEPCDYKDNDLQRFYPVKDRDGLHAERYESYAALANQDQRTTFIGRCGTYRYLDMHQVVNQSLVGAAKWLASHNLSEVCN